MHTDYPSASLSWPELPDEAAVALQGVLHDFVMLFESHYLGQIERYYRDSMLMCIGEGSNEILRTVIAKQLIDRHRI